MSLELYQVVPGTRQGGSFEMGHGYRNQFAGRNSWWVGKKWIDMEWNAGRMKWNDMPWMNARINEPMNEWMNELNWIEMNDLKEMH